MDYVAFIETHARARFHCKTSYRKPKTDKPSDSFSLLQSAISLNEKTKLNPIVCVSARRLLL